MNSCQANFRTSYKIEGVRHELTVPKTPQQNRVAERLNRTLVESAITMLIQAKLPQAKLPKAVVSMTVRDSELF